MKHVQKAFVNGVVASMLLSLFYGVVVFSISGKNQLEEQVRNYWYYLLPLALGFGVQVGLYSYAKSIMRGISPKILASSGTTSTAAMISCCSHYLVNLMPVLGVTGIVTIITQYQTKLFWLGLLSNLLGILYILMKIRVFSRRQ